ncbi:MAG: KilA-N domain-containing protein [Cyanobacteria bacterium J06631_2]
MKILYHQANGLQISQRHQDGYINATQMCQANNKEWRYY